MVQGPIKLAMIQMTVKGAAPDENRAHALAKMLEASRNGADIALLPEAMNLGWTDPSATTQAEPIPDGPTCKAFIDAAKELNIMVCAGIVEKTKNAVYNSAVLIDSTGELLLVHRKIHEIEPGLQYYKTGDTLAAVETSLGKIGVMICADAFIEHQVIGRTLAAMGAQIILSPCAWAVPADHNNQKDPYGGFWVYHYGAITKDNNVWIAGTSNVGPITGGPWKGQNCIGCSMLVAPGGEQKFQGDYGVNRDTIYYVDIPLNSE